VVEVLKLRTFDSQRSNVRRRDDAGRTARATAKRALSAPSDADVTYLMCQVTFGDLPLAASLQTISIMRSTIISDFTPANDTGGIFRSGFVVCRLPFSIQKTAVRFQR
jgi:hypothetical protein